MLKIFQFVSIFRLVRIIKIARYIVSIQIMLTKTVKSLKEVGPFAALLFLFIFLFALVGRELFAYIIIIDENGEFVYGDQI